MLPQIKQNCNDYDYPRLLWQTGGNLFGHRKTSVGGALQALHALTD